MSDPIDDLARLWEWTAKQQLHGYSPLYDQIALAVAHDREVLRMVATLPPASHFPLALLGAVHYLVLDGLDHPLAEVYAGRTDARPAPLFLEVCRTHWDEIEALLAVRHVQTNDCGRSALIGPGLTWLASRLTRPPALVDVGTSAGLSLLCDRYRLDYGAHGVTGPAHSPVEVACRIVAGDPPIAKRLPGLASRVGIDRSPLDVSNPEDARWLLACVWPDTGRLERTAASIHLARDDLPELVRGDANEVLPGVLADLPGATPAIVMTTWAFAYFSLEQRHRFVEILDRASQTRPIAWLSAEGPGIVEGFGADAPERHQHAGDVLGAVLYDHGTRQEQLLALTHPHGHWMDWRGPAA
ncbi:MAG: DUF2332 domain-containing protein [Acidimicrobiales bacterium]